MLLFVVTLVVDVAVAVVGVFTYAVARVVLCDVAYVVVGIVGIVLARYVAAVIPVVVCCYYAFACVAVDAVVRTVNAAAYATVVGDDCIRVIVASGVA